MKTAIFYKKTNQLFLFDSKNTAEYVNCKSVVAARLKIKNTGVEQSLVVNNK